jgi:hypothetical protein
MIVVGDCMFELAALRKYGAAAHIGLLIVWIELDRPGGIGERAVEVVLPKIDQGAPCVDAGIARIEPNRLVVIGNSLIKIFQIRIRVGTSDVSVPIFGVELDDLRVVCSGVIEVLFFSDIHERASDTPKPNLSWVPCPSQSRSYMRQYVRPTTPWGPGISPDRPAHGLVTRSKASEPRRQRLRPIVFLSSIIPQLPRAT